MFGKVIRFLKAATARLAMVVAWVFLTAMLAVAFWGIGKLLIMVWALLSAITIADVVVVALITAAVYTAVRVLWFLFGVSLEMVISSVEFKD